MSGMIFQFQQAVVHPQPDPVLPVYQDVLVYLLPGKGTERFDAEDVRISFVGIIDMDDV